MWFPDCGDVVLERLVGFNYQMSFGGVDQALIGLSHHLKSRDVTSGSSVVSVP